MKQVEKPLCGEGTFDELPFKSRCQKLFEDFVDKLSQILVDDELLFKSHLSDGLKERALTRALPSILPQFVDKPRQYRFLFFMIEQYPSKVPYEGDSDIYKFVYGENFICTTDTDKLKFIKKQVSKVLKEHSMDIRQKKGHFFLEIDWSTVSVFVNERPISAVDKCWPVENR